MSNKFSNLSDFEIDCLVTAEEYKKFCMKIGDWSDYTKEWYKSMQDGNPTWILPYCTNRDYNTKLCASNGIELTFTFNEEKELYSAVVCFNKDTDRASTVELEGENLLRINMEAYLLMQYEEE